MTTNTASVVPANAILVDGWTPGTSGDDVFELGTAQGNVSNSTGGDTYYVTDFADTSRHVLYLDDNDVIDISNVVTVPTGSNVADYIQIARNTDTTAHIKVDTDGTGSNYQLLLTVKNMDEAALTAAFENGQIVYNGASNAPTETGPQSAPTVVSGASVVPANAILVDGWTPGTSGDDVFELGTAQGNVSNSTGGDTYYVTDFADTSRHVLYLDGNDAIDISNVVTVPTGANVADYIQIARNTDTTAHIKVDTEGTGSNYQLLLTVKNMDEVALTAAFENGQVIVGGQLSAPVGSLEPAPVNGNATNEGANLSEPNTSQGTNSSQQEEDIYSTLQPGDVINGSIFLGTLVFRDPDEPCGTCGDGDGNNFSQNTNENQSNEASVEIIGIEHVETAIISNSGGPISGRVTLLTADEYIIEHGAKLEATYNANLAGLETLGLGNATLPEINFWMPFHLHEANAPEAWSIVDEKFFEARELVDQGHSVAEAQLNATGTTTDEFVFSDAKGNYAEANIINQKDVIVSSGLDVSNGVQIINAQISLLPSYVTKFVDPNDQPENLSLNDLSQIGIYASSDTHEGRVAYYEALEEKGYSYAGLALGVVKDDSLAGIVARDYATAVGQSVGVNLSEQQWDEISQALIEADFAAREQLILSGATDQSLDFRVIQGYHNSVFEDFGLPRDAWTPNVILNNSKNPEEAWDNLVSAGGLTTMWNYRGFMNDIDALAAEERIEHLGDLYTEINGTLVPNDATINNDAWMLENMPAAFQAQTLWSADLLGSTVHEWVVDGTIESLDDFVNTAQDFISDTYENIAEWIF